MITVEQFESGKVEIPDDDYIAIESFTDLQLIQMLEGHKVTGKIVRFEGVKTGIVLHPDFCEVLEK